MDIDQEIIAGMESKGWALYKEISEDHTFRKIIERGREKYFLEQNTRYIIFPLVNKDWDPYEIIRAMKESYEAPAFKFFKHFDTFIYKVPLDSLILDGRLNLIVDKSVIPYTEGAIDPAPHIKNLNIWINYNNINEAIEHISEYVTLDEREREIVKFMVH